MTIHKGLEIYAERRDFGRSVGIAFAQYVSWNRHCIGDQYGTKRLMAKPIEMVEVGDDIIQEPTVSLTVDQAQQLMDALWSCGLRPTEGSGSAGALAATQHHLEDMRKIATKLLDKQIDTKEKK